MANPVEIAPDEPVVSAGQGGVGGYGLCGGDILWKPPHEVPRHQLPEIELEILESRPRAVHPDFLAVERKRRDENLFRQPGRRVQIQMGNFLDADRGARSEETNGDGGCGKSEKNKWRATHSGR